MKSRGNRLGFGPRHDAKREQLRGIAKETLEAIDCGHYVLNGTMHDLSAGLTLSQRNTQYYAPDSLLSAWFSTPAPGNPASTEVALLEVSTLEGGRLLATMLQANQASKIGALNFASAVKPGGGFKSGAQAQEESIARSSTLYATLMTPLAQTFYSVHNSDTKHGYYSHAMVYSPGVVVFRADSGEWVEPMEIDVLTSAAVNAGQVRQTLTGHRDASGVEERIGAVMKERMARILFLFEKQGVRNVVLGSFGTGVFRNNINLVANIWADLLLEEGARFKTSFAHVMFAILGRPTFEEFERVFEERKPRVANL
ncbi:uncharacterized protein FIBRA_05107 [Fibroporia radiculosa]|uniref:Microbial-type PARG catalytic domain-containing protein n=1 Tax=Fibroporia radiculosa TaxID=599839 RepID=J4HWZ2_9APHY|nr:uncharacterized protein FIBRA_05107 [Fibroporia radiculosa]CCM02992.1 predicted protein [Fibroporia radiculosa]